MGSNNSTVESGDRRRGQLDTTREGFPALWGLTEIAVYAEEAAAAYPELWPLVGGRRLPVRRAEVWSRRNDFPDPVARLQMGPVFLVDEVAPWLEERLAKGELGKQPLPAHKVRAILMEKGLMSENRAAMKHGVSNATVHRIWTR